MSMDGTGMSAPANNEPAGAVTSREVARKKPYQGKLRSNVQDQRAVTKIDTNKHGIRRETTTGRAKKTGRKKV